MKKVIIIGNGCSALDYEVGNRIDTEFDLVIRMNRYVTKGFERFVGTKTDVWAITDNIYTNNLVNKNPKQIIEGVTNIDSIPFILTWTPNFKGDYITNYTSNYDNKITHINENHGLENHIKTKVNLGSRWPTLGLISIYYCLLNNWEVNIYGFDNKSTKYEYLHYYDIGDPNWLTTKYYSNYTDLEGKRKDHDDNIEALHMESLIKDKIINQIT